MNSVQDCTDLIVYAFHVAVNVYTIGNSIEKTHP